MGEAVSIEQVLLFADEQRALDLAPFLAPVLQEVRAFWEHMSPAPNFSHHLAGRVPFNHPDIARLGARPLPGIQGDELWAQSRGRYSRTADPDRLAATMRNMPEDRPDVLMVVTDQELTPPPGWRYLIATDVEDESTTVVSTAPADPRYWGLDPTDRRAIIKHRIRTVLLGAVGEWLELECCENPRCVMFQHVDSVDRLDAMVVLGTEHRSPRLSLKGYDPHPDDPTRMQPIIKPRMPPDMMAV